MEHAPEHEANSVRGLWEMYETARAESIAAQQSMQNVISWTMAAAALVLAGLAYLVDSKAAQWQVMSLGWLVAATVGLLATSQYAGEVGRMLRAGYFARQLERIATDNAVCELPHYRMWESFLSEERDGKQHNRLYFTYGMSAVGALAALVAVQFAPFLLFVGEKTTPAWYWWSLPTIGTIGTLALTAMARQHYLEQFPPKD